MSCMEDPPPSKKIRITPSAELEDDDPLLCKYGCDRIICPGTTNRGNKYDTCCRSCAVKKGDTLKHDKQCDKRNISTKDKKWKPDSNGIYKIGINDCVEYGDGGQSEMIWDIFVCDNLNTVDTEIVSILKKELIKLGEMNNDWRENEPIQNLIDPDLYIYKYYDKEQYWLSTKHRKDFDKNFECFLGDLDKGFYDDEDKEWMNKNHPKTHWKELQENDEKGYFIRRKYQWLATQCIEYNTNKIQIISTIHNISPRCKYENIYNGIQHILEKMLPLFNKFEIFKNRELEEFQVIIKSQRYEIDDMSGYSGHWHQEGLTENIVIAGIYYFEVNDGLIGGNLRFRNISGPDADYSQYTYPSGNYNDDVMGTVNMVHEAEINEGTAIVFDNVNLVHRVRMIKNKINDKQKRYRSFLAFFIVDPEKEIKSTKNISTLKKEEYIDIFIKYTIIKSNDIASLICDYGACGYTLNEAKNLRKLNIEVRMKPTTKGKFGSYHFGNCGDQIWFNHGKAHPFQHECINDKNEINWITTTNSEL